MLDWCNCCNHVLCPCAGAGDRTRQRWIFSQLFCEISFRRQQRRQNSDQHGYWFTSFLVVTTIALPHHTHCLSFQVFVGLPRSDRTKHTALSFRCCKKKRPNKAPPFLTWRAHHRCYCACTCTCACCCCAYVRHSLKSLWKVGRYVVCSLLLFQKSHASHLTHAHTHPLTHPPTSTQTPASTRTPTRQRTTNILHLLINVLLYLIACVHVCLT